MTRPSAKQIARELETTMRCCCDLDNWEPERSTGHSHVCRIHKEAIRLWMEGGRNGR